MIRLTEVPSQKHVLVPGTAWIKLTSLESTFLVPKWRFTDGQLIPARISLGGGPPINVWVLWSYSQEEWAIIMPKNSLPSVPLPPHWMDVRSASLWGVRPPSIRFVPYLVYVDPSIGIRDPSHRPLTDKEVGDCQEGVVALVLNGKRAALAEQLPELTSLEVLLNSGHVARRRRR